MRQQNAMVVCLYLEARDPSGARYRLGLGLQLPPALASILSCLTALF